MVTRMMTDAGLPQPSGCQPLDPRVAIDTAVEAREGRMCVLRGTACVHDATVAIVEVSTDGGESWHEATLTGPNEPAGPVEWEHPWVPEAPGVHTLLARATDSRGRRHDVGRDRLRVSRA